MCVIYNYLISLKIVLFIYLRLFVKRVRQEVTENKHYKLKRSYINNHETSRKESLNSWFFELRF